MNNTKVKDLTGKRFGKWKVLKLVKNKQKRSSWLCRCDCGKEQIIGPSGLIKNKTNGCAKCAGNKGRNFNDLSGSTIGHLKILKLVSKKDKIWLARCTCGNNVTYTTSKIRSKNNSCGCIKSIRKEHKIQELTGRKFNNFTVLEKSPNRKSGKIAWMCKCSCGTIKEVEGGTLTTGNTKSCGCIAGKARQIKVTPGDVFGLLTIIKEVEGSVRSSGRKDRKFKCICDCGNTVVKSLKDLRRSPNKQKSCGCHLIETPNFINTTIKNWKVVKNEGDKYLCKCLKCGSGSIFSRENLIKQYKLNCTCSYKPKYIQNHLGEIFGELLITEKHKNKYKCHCYLCGNHIITTYKSLLSGKIINCGCVSRKLKLNEELLKKKDTLLQFIGKTFGRLTVITKCAYRYNNIKKVKSKDLWLCVCSCGKSKIVTSNNLLNKNNRSCGCLRFEISYQGRYNLNIKSKRDVLRTTKIYKMWRNTVLKRDKHTCHICNIKKSTMVVHHILSFSRYKKHRYDPNNGITLCRKCHDEFHNKYTSTIFTPEDFIEFYKYKNQGNK